VKRGGGGVGAGREFYTRGVVEKKNSLARDRVLNRSRDGAHAGDGDKDYSDDDYGGDDDDTTWPPCHGRRSSVSRGPPTPDDVDRRCAARVSTYTTLAHSVHHAIAPSKSVRRVRLQYRILSWTVPRIHPRVRLQLFQCPATFYTTRSVGARECCSARPVFGSLFVFAHVLLSLYVLLIVRSFVVVYNT